MNLLFSKQWMHVVVLLLSTYSTVYANELLAYTVLNFPYERLPFDQRHEKPWVEIITTQQEWQAFYNKLNESSLLDFPPAPSAPAIDFEQYRLLAGGLGVKTSGGHSLLVERIDERDEDIHVSVIDVRPDTGWAVTAALTYPSAAILIKKSAKPLTFSTSTLVRECP